MADPTSDFRRAVAEHGLETSALAYAARGWPVFPCRPRDKRPATARGLHDASTDERVIRAWWGQNPACNVAVATGPASDLLVLDIDGDVRELLGGRSVPQSPTQRTGGGGWQVLFQWDPALADVSTTRAGLLPGIDTRGRGGYVVVPPSVHPNGTRYRWGRCTGPDDLPLAEPPAWLLNALTPPPPAAATPRTIETANADRYVRAAIERECLELAGTPKGTRNAALNRSAYALARFVAAGQADEAGVVRALAYAAASTGLSAWEISRTIQSAFAARQGAT